MFSTRQAAIAATVLLLGAAPPAHASLTMNALVANALVANALVANGLAATGSLSDLNSVTVQSVILPAAAPR